MMRDLDRRFAFPPPSERGIAIPSEQKKWGLAEILALFGTRFCVIIQASKVRLTGQGGDTVNDENLKPLQANTERAREIGRLGGIASGEARRKKRTMREAAQQILSGGLMFGDDNTRAILAALGIDVPTNADGLVLVATLKAGAGDIEAMRFVRDTGGEVPTSKVEVGGIEDKPIEVIDLSALSDAQLQELAAKRLESE